MGAFRLPGDVAVLLAVTLAGQIGGQRVFRPLLHSERYERVVLAALVVTARLIFRAHLPGVWACVPLGS